MAPSALRLFAIIGCAFAMACADSAEYARLSVDGNALVPDCAADAFPFEPTFLSAKTHQGRTGIFLQSPRDVYHRTDVALIQFYDDAISDGTSVELAAGTDPGATARAKLAFFSSCPDELETLELRGTIEIDQFDPGDGYITGRLLDGYAVDARTAQTVIDSISGSWHLRVRRGVPHQDFFALPEADSN